MPKGQQPWSKEAKENARLRKRMAMEHEHQQRMALLSILREDPEMKYFLGVAGGAATGVIGKMLTGVMGGTETAQAPPETDSSVPWAWLIAGANPYTLPIGALESISGKITTSGDNFGSLLAMGGTGFSGFCSMVLILKAIFGDEDVATLAQGLGSLVPFS